jgi:hypothetical protein
MAIVTGVSIARLMSCLTGRQSRAIVAGNAGAQEHCPVHSRAKNARKWKPRHGHVFDNNKHRDSHIQATIGRAGSVTDQQSSSS